MEWYHKKVKKLEYIAAKKVFYYTLNLAYIFQYSSWYYCTCNRFQGCRLENGEKDYYYISRFQNNYHSEKINKCINPKDIAALYKQMKKDLKKCVIGQ